MKYKPLLICHFIIAALLGTFLWPVTREFWELFDTAIFQTLNGTLKDAPLTQLFWGLINHKKADLVEDTVFLIFFIFAIVKAPPGQKLRRTAQFLFCILLSGSIIYFVNRTLLREHTLIPRVSPSLVVTPCVRLSHELPGLLVKDQTLASFPGDHATTLLLFVGLYTTFAGRRWGFYATLYAIFRILPRLVVGAHWCSDILVGSGSLALFFLSWALCSPFHTWAIDKIERFLKLWKKDEVQEKPL